MSLEEKETSLINHLLELQNVQNTILEKMVDGTALREILFTIAQFIETHSEKSVCSITLFNQIEPVFANQISPDFLINYINPFNNISIGPDSGLEKIRYFS